MKQGKAFYELYCWIIRGSQRRLVLSHLNGVPITAEELRRKINANLPPDMKPLSLREMSRQLTSFSDKKIIKCLSPHAPYNKPYILTKKGEILSKEIGNRPI